MQPSELAAAIANSSAISLKDALNAAEFVLHLVRSDRRLTVDAMPRPANSNLRVLEQLILFEEPGGERARTAS